MNKKTKRGFTIVELVIVIAVIAILAAVLIPTFASVIKKANLSADQQAVATINKQLAIIDADDLGDIAEVKAALGEADIDANNYKPLTKGHNFFWDASANRVVLVDEKGEVVFPKDVTVDNSKWFSLSGNVATEKVKVNNGTVSVTGTAQVVGALTDASVISKAETITLTGTTNMQGASINIAPTSNITIGGTESAPATIQNVVSDEGTKVSSNAEQFVGNHYYAGLVKTVPAGKTVTIENLVIDGAVIGDSSIDIGDTARVGIIAGQVSGTLIIRNVTIKNSSVFGGYRVGALVGAVTAGGKVYIENVTTENVTVKGGTNTAKLIGDVKKNSVVSVSGTNNFDGITVTALPHEGTIDENNMITYVNGAYPNGNTTCAYVTNEWFWIQHGYTWNDTADQSKGYVSNDEAKSANWNA